MDTEFPGVVARPTNPTSNHRYQTMRLNVNMCKIIQLGIFICDKDGNYIPNKCCWQFNFRFDEYDDLYAVESIDLLRNSGINFEELKVNGIDFEEFGEVLTTSGIVLNPRVRWISFHSGFDFGFLIKLLTSQMLPMDEEKFYELLNIYCPNIYDIKYITKSCNDLRGGLQKISETLNVTRVGPQHQAGSDSLMTAAAFFCMAVQYFEGRLDDQKYLGVIYGLGHTGTGNGLRKVPTPLPWSPYY
uniref:poly(A)-specific ribonuclease n=1 Tax=Lygus hesperus TaxID=30085 RepID=A0A0A9ZCZ9_LYGHE